MTPRPVPKPDRNASAILKWEMVGAFFVIAAGSLFHFLSGRPGFSCWLTILLPLNDSLWENFKMGYWPLLLYALGQSLWMRWKTANFWGGKAAGLIFMQATIIALVYSYTSVSGHRLLFVDIGIYVLAVLLCQAVSFWILAKSRPWRAFNKLGIWIFILQGLAFILFTFATPHLPIFMDSRTGAYGMPK